MCKLKLKKLQKKPELFVLILLNQQQLVQNLASFPRPLKRGA